MTTLYKELLSGKRLRKSQQEGRGPAAEAMSDKGRIITSGSFRRLQSKAQVFSLEENPGVRTRLTHTLEVALYGVTIANNIVKSSSEVSSLSEEEKSAFVTLVDSACLVHDIGNPPFGHLGEYAIRHWFVNRKTELVELCKSQSSSPEIDDFIDGFISFDGNAQAFRILSRLQWLEDEYGLNLSNGLLSSFIKYLDYKKNANIPFGSKAGFFKLDQERLAKIWNELGLKTDAESLNQRSPLAFIMEAADDIAYCLSDIEDALEKKIVSEDEFFMYYKGDSEASNKPESISGPSDAVIARNGRFVKLKVRLAMKLINEAAEKYLQNENEILEGRFHESLLSDNDLLKKLNKFAIDKIYSSDEAIKIELSGQKIIRSILDEYWILLKAKPEDMERLEQSNPNPPKKDTLAIEKRLYMLLPNKHKLVYEHMKKENPDLEIIYRLHLIVDFVSGMTDGHALKISQMLNGSPQKNLL